MNYGSLMKVYAARDYHGRSGNLIDVNIPNVLPTVPKDDTLTTIGVPAEYVANVNFPVTKSEIKISHCISLPLLSGTTCPDEFYRGAPFLLFMPTGKVEEGYLLYI